ncbi:MAG: hypothetical protein PUB52_11235 [Lachnospiraceae bacterium]|nr:hypothetical protein [Lachnospiraceae bacterium]
MVDLDKMYFIVDMQGDFYKLGKREGLVRAKSREEAGMFTLFEANRHMSGKKEQFYSMIPVEEDNVEEQTSYDAPEYDEVEKPTMFDTLHNNWEEMLSSLCYMSDHMDEYQNNLKEMLSEVDKEICDIMHYLEFNELSDKDMIKASRMLQERRRHRREIKDEMEKTALMKSTFLDGAFGIKVQQSLEFMEKMKQRQYTPRKLTELFAAVS